MPYAGVHGTWFQLAPGFPSTLPTAAKTDTLLLRIAIQGLPNYLWSNALCKKNECDGPWDSHLESFDRGLLGPILLNDTQTGAVAANLTHAEWTVCAGLAGEALNLSSPAAADPGWRRGTGPLTGTGTWVRLRLPLPAAALTSDGEPAGIGLNLTGMQAGEAWVNGHSVGRYTLRKIGPEKDCTICNRTGPFDPNNECHSRCGSYSEPLYHTPRDWLEPSGLNTVIMWETQSGADPSGVAFASVVGGEPSRL